MAAFPNTRALFKKREKLEALIEAAIDCLDSLDGDTEAESSIGFDMPELDEGETDIGSGDDELHHYAKVIRIRQASAIRRKVQAELAFIQHERAACYSQYTARDVNF